MGGERVKKVHSGTGGPGFTGPVTHPDSMGLKAKHKGHSNNRVLVTRKDKLLYKDDYYLERKISHREAERLFERFRREIVQCNFATSWSGVLT